MSHVTGLQLFRQALEKSAPIEETDPAPIIEWLRKQREKVDFTAELIPVKELHGWSADEATGNIVHASGAFFSIEGIRTRAGDGLREVASWDQPILNQSEGGVLALVARITGETVQFLLQAKAEPGNIGKLQLAPTLQSTWSNLKRAHSGKRPPMADVVAGELPGIREIYRAAHNEEGGRFFKKSNDNVIVLVGEDTPTFAIPENQFIWATLSQIKALCLMDNLVNTFVKTIIAPL